MQSTPSFVHIFATRRAISPTLAADILALPLGVLLRRFSFWQFSVGGAIVMEIAESFLSGASFSAEGKAGHQGE
ncbi:hypothetical protein X949_4778 [Burkholderia pseudomallei MSHR5609]|nr:hypothetical protein X949_4778 [Burkholderia pseudomallei MSHR5609]